MAVIVKGKNPRKPHTVRYRLDGRQRERSFKTKREADDFKAKFEHDSREQIFVDPRLGSITFADAAASWLAAKQASARTKELYGEYLTNHINPAIGGHTIRQVAADRDGMKRWLLEILPGKVGRSIIESCYSNIIKPVLNECVRAGKIPGHKLDGIEMPPRAGKGRDFYSPTWEQLEILATELREFGYTVWLMRGCGLRIGEALAVTGEQLLNGTLRISEKREADGSYGPLKARQPGDYRDIPLPRYVKDKAPRASGRLFPPIAQSSYRWRFRAACRKAGIPATFTPHSLRHCYASETLAAGIEITEVSDWLGHRSIQLTFETYGHVVPSAFDRARDVLDASYSA
jgi:integrase